MEKEHESLKKLWKNPEQILSTNAFRVLKVLVQLDKNKPEKVKVKDIQRIITDLSTSEIYESLNELKEKGYVENKRPYWILKFPKIEKGVKRKFSFWEWLDKRSERKRLEESRVFKPEALPLVESIHKRYGYKWLEPFIQHDREVNKKLDELRKNV